MKKLSEFEMIALSMAVDYYLNTNPLITKEEKIFKEILISAKNKLDERTN